MAVVSTRKADPVEQRLGVAADGFPIDRAGAIDRILFEEDVLRHGELGDQGDLLEDHLDPLPDGIAGVVHLRLAPGDADAAGILGIDPGEDLDQRRLAGAVLAHEGVHLAGLETEIDVLQRDHAREALADPGHFERKTSVLDDGEGGVSRHRRASAPGRDRWR